VHDNLCKVMPRPSLLMVQVHGEKVSSKGHEFELLSVHTLYTCRSVVGRLQVRESVRYIIHNSYAISVVSPFNKYIKLSSTLNITATTFTAALTVQLVSKQQKTFKNCYGLLSLMAKSYNSNGKSMI